MAVVGTHNPAVIRPKSAKLASVKFELYDATLPTLRKMDRDDVLQRLPYEHSRTSRVFAWDKREGLQEKEDLARLTRPRKPAKWYTENWRSVLEATLKARQPLDTKDSPINMPFKITSTVNQRPMAATMYPQLYFQYPWK